jgi:hypothetical protein
LSVVIAEKLLLRSLTEIVGTDPPLEPEPEPPDELEDGPLLPQAAATSAALATTAAAAVVLVTERKETTSLMGGTIRITGRCRAPHDRSPLGRNLLRKP